MSSMVGVGVGFNLGAATGYLFVDATGIRRGLDVAQTSFASFEQKAEQRSQQATRALNAATAATKSAILSTAATLASQANAQSQVVAATASASLQIADSYDRRGKAIAALTKTTLMENQRVADAEAKALELQKKRADLEKRIRQNQDRKDRGLTTGLGGGNVDKEIAGLTRALNKVKQDSATANRSLGQIRKSAVKNIEVATAASNAIVTAANAQQARSLDAVRARIRDQTQLYRNLAADQGASAKRAADLVAAAGRRQIVAIEALEVAYRKEEAARQRVNSTTGLENVQAVSELERATFNRVRAEDAVVQARNRQVRAEQTASERLQQIHNKNAAAAEKEAARLVKAVRAEAEARRHAIQENIGRISGTLSVIGLASAAAMAATTRQFIQFEEQLRNISSISADVSFVMTEMRQKVLDLGVATGQAPTQLAKALYDVVSSGFDGADALTLLDASAKAAVAGMSDVATAGKSITAVLNAYKDASSGAALSIKDVGKVSDVAFQGVKDGVFTFEELTQQQGDNLTIAAELGVSYEELVSSFVVLTRAGNSLAESTTQINGIMRTFLKPNEDLAAAIRKYGQEVLGVTDLTGAALVQQYGFGEALKFVEQVAGDDADMLGRLFPNVRALRGQVALSGAGLKLYNDELAKMRDASADGGATQKAFAEQTKAVAFQLRQAKESFRVAAIEIGGTFGPGLILAANAAEDVARALSFVNKATGGTVGILLAISATSLIATAGIVRLYQGLAGTIGALKNLRDLEVFSGLVAGGRRFLAMITVMIARMRAFIATASMAQLVGVAGIVGIALAAAAYGVYKLVQAQKKEDEQVKKLTELYKELNVERNSRSVIQDPEHLARVNAEAKAVETLMKSYQDLDDNLEKVIETQQRLTAQAFPTGSPGAQIIDPRSQVGPQARGGPQLVDIAEFADRMRQGKIDAEEVKQITEIIDGLLQQTGIDQEKASAAAQALIDEYIRQAEAGLLLANSDEVLIANLQALQNETDLYKTGVVGMSEATDDLSDYTEDAAERGERFRNGLIAVKDQLYAATGAMADAQDPLQVLREQFGATDDSAIELLLRLDSLRTFKMTNLAEEGRLTAENIQAAFMGLNFTAPQREALQLADAVNKTTDAVKAANAEIEKHRQAASDLAQTQDLVRQTIGDEGDGYAALNAMLQSGQIDQEQYNQIKAAGIYLFNDSARAIEEENKQMALGLVDLAKRTAAQRNAQKAYEQLTPEQKAYASRLQDENFLLAIQLVLMAQWLEATGQLEKGVSFTIATNLAEVVPGFGEFVNQTDLLNGKQVTTTLTVRNDPALQSIEAVNTEIEKTKKIIDQLEADKAKIKASGRDVPDNLDQTINDQQKKLDTLLEMRQEFVDGAQAVDDSFNADGMPGIPSDDQVKDAGDKFSRIEDYFKSAEDAAQSFGSGVSSAIDEALNLTDALADISDPVKVLTKQWGLANDSVENLILNASRRKLVDLDQDEKAALRLKVAIQGVEQSIEDWNAATQKSQDEMAKWQGIADMLDDVLGKQEDGYNKLYQLQQAGLVSEEEAQAAIQASLFLRNRAAQGILEERARIVKSLPALADYVAKHDSLTTSYDNLSNDQKGFLAALEDENVQMQLNTAVMLAMLEAMGAIPKGVTTKFLADAAEANPVLGALLEDINFLEGTHTTTVELKTKGELDAEQNLPPAQTTTTVEAKIEGEASVNRLKGTVDGLTDKSVTITVNLAGTEHVIEVLTGFTPIVGSFGTAAGVSYDVALATALAENAPTLRSAIAPLSDELTRMAEAAERAGYYGGTQFDYGMAQGMVDKSSWVGRAARYVAGVALVEMRNALLVRSPSRAAAEIGGHTTVGFAQGMVSKAAAAAASARQVVRTAGQAMRDEAERQNAQLAAAGGLASADALARSGGGFRALGNGVAARDLSTIGRPAVGAGNHSSVMNQQNNITIPIDGSQHSPEAIANVVERRLFRSINTLAVKGVQA